MVVNKNQDLFNKANKANKANEAKLKKENNKQINSLQSQIDGLKDFIKEKLTSKKEVEPTATRTYGENPHMSKIKIQRNVMELAQNNYNKSKQENIKYKTESIGASLLYKETFNDLIREGNSVINAREGADIKVKKMYPDFFKFCYFAPFSKTYGSSKLLTIGNVTYQFAENEDTYCYRKDYEEIHRYFGYRPEIPKVKIPTIKTALRGSGSTIQTGQITNANIMQFQENNLIDLENPQESQANLDSEIKKIEERNK